MVSVLEVVSQASNYIEYNKDPDLTYSAGIDFYDLGSRRGSWQSE